MTAIDKILAIHVYRVSQSTSGVCFIEAELSVSWLKPLRADPVSIERNLKAIFVQTKENKVVQLILNGSRFCSLVRVENHFLALLDLIEQLSNDCRK